MTKEIKNIIHITKSYSNQDFEKLKSYNINNIAYTENSIETFRKQTLYHFRNVAII